MGLQKKRGEIFHIEGYSKQNLTHVYHCLKMEFSWVEACFNILIAFYISIPCDDFFFLFLLSAIGGEEDTWMYSSLSL